MNGRSGRFFRYLHLKTCGQIISTVMPIGKGPCSQVGINVAKFLGLSNAEEYTGQTWRGTASTFAADSGLHDSEIQNITGHKSIEALKVYKANSEPQKQKVSAALSLTSRKENVEPSRKKARPDVVVAAGSRNISITLNSSNITTLQIQQRPSLSDDDDEEDVGELEEFDDDDDDSN